jgi:outer membrane lipoprotein-sorting protein
MYRFALLLIAVLVLSGCGRPTPRPVDKFSACSMAKTFVTQSLKAPSTAKWPTCREQEQTFVSNAGNVWTVRSWVDAQNSFGAAIRTTYMIEMRYTPATNTWQVLDLITSP